MKTLISTALFVGLVATFLCSSISLLLAQGGGCTGGCHIVNAIARQSANNPGQVLEVTYFGAPGQGMNKLATGPSIGTYKTVPNAVVNFSRCDLGSAPLCPFLPPTNTVEADGANFNPNAQCVSGTVQRRTCVAP